MAQASVRQYMDRVSGGMDSARSSNMLYAPLPMLVFDATTGEVLWSNDMFLQLTSQKEKIFEMLVDTVVPDFSYRWLLDGKREYPELFHWNGRIYRVFGALSHPEEMQRDQNPLATTYWMDVTDSEEMRQTLELTRPLVAILMVDNYEELMKACPESKRSAVLAALEEQLNDWAADSGGLLLGYDRDRYLFVFEEKDYGGYTEKKFDVLEKVRQVQAGEGVSATLSIGVGRDEDSFDQLFKNASLALEMALSRGEGPGKLRVLRRAQQVHGEADKGEVPGHGQRAGRADRRRQAGIRYGSQVRGHGLRRRGHGRVLHRPEAGQEVPDRH